MEKRSRRRIRDLVARPASLGLSENEIGCARISMMARNTNVPFKGRIQKRKTYHLQIITFRLQRAAGPYRSCPTKAHGISCPGTYEATHSSGLARMRRQDRRARGAGNPSDHQWDSRRAAQQWLVPSRAVNRATASNRYPAVEKCDSLLAPCRMGSAR